MSDEPLVGPVLEQYNIDSSWPEAKITVERYENVLPPTYPLLDGWDFYMIWHTDTIEGREGGGPYRWRTRAFVDDAADVTAALFTLGQLIQRAIKLKANPKVDQSVIEWLHMRYGVAV